jgi:hypothetical protein
MSIEHAKQLKLQLEKEVIGGNLEAVFIAGMGNLGTCFRVC